MLTGLLAGGPTGTAVAEGTGPAPALLAAWQDWAAKAPITRSTLAILIDGQVVERHGHRAPRDTIMPVASLSKAVTAACAAKVDLGPERDVAPLLDLPGPLTVRELETHTAGIRFDTTQNNPRFAPGEPAPNLRALAVETLARQRGKPGGDSAYNNLNYAVLGAAIQSASGAPYGEVCHDAVFAPLGLDQPHLAHDWGHHGPWGGWALSAADYALFAWATFGPGTKVDQAAVPANAVEVAPGIFTQSGVFWTIYDGNRIVWSVGLLCWNDRCDGSYVARYGDAALVVVLFSGGIAASDAHTALDRAMAEAALRR